MNSNIFDMRVARFINHAGFYALTLLVVMVAAYGWQVLHPGFFWDDWQAIYLTKLNSPAAFWEYFLKDRPISAWTFIMTGPLLGIDPLRWQIFTLMIRWLGVLALVEAFRNIWPGRIWQVRWVGWLLVVYPGFTQQPVSVAYSQHFITFALYAVSLLLMVKAERHPRQRWVYTFPALAFALIQMLTMEYFVGLELLRPLLLWYLLRQESSNPSVTARKTLLRWLPYLAMLALFVVYRFVIFPRIASEADINAPYLLLALRTEKLSALIRLIQISLQDSIYALVFAWANTIAPNTINLTAKFVLLSWAIGAAIASLVAGYACRPENASVSEAKDHDHLGPEFILLGFLGLMLGGLPFWSTNRQIIVGAWSSRFSLAPMVGVVILLVGLLEWLSGIKNRKAIFLAILLALSIAFQLQIANKYRLQWEYQRSYFWQMTWRIPALEQNTAIVVPEIPFNYVSDISLGFALNTIYSNQKSMSDIPYWLFSAGRNWTRKELPSIINGQELDYLFRNIAFHGTTHEVVGINFKPLLSCLRVLTPEYKDAPPLAAYPISEIESIVAQATHPERILRQPAFDEAVMRQIFGPEPKHDWCYYFEKADLARQYQDWAEVARISEEAARQGWMPRAQVERLPEIEAYAHLGQWEKASGIILAAYQQEPNTQVVMCETWDRIMKGTISSGGRDLAAQKITSTLGCLK